jgi:hypothetical protein
MWTTASPRSQHVSQLAHAGGAGLGSGWDDCGPASVLRYLREAGKVDPAGDIPAQLSDIAYRVRGTADSAANGPVDVNALSSALRNYGVATHYSETYADAEKAPWSVVLVDAFQLAPAQYPQDAGWLGTDSGSGDHYILWLPQWQGSAYWFNDPLAYNNGQQDCQYAAASIQTAFRCALVLPTTGHGEDAAPLPAPPTPAPTPLRRMVSAACTLKPAPSHQGAGVMRNGQEVQIPAHGQLIDTWVRTNGWARVQYTDLHGWVPANLIVPVA